MIQSEMSDAGVLIEGSRAKVSAELAMEQERLAHVFHLAKILLAAVTLGVSGASAAAWTTGYPRLGEWMELGMFLRPLASYTFVFLSASILLLKPSDGAWPAKAEHGIRSILSITASGVALGLSLFALSRSIDPPLGYNASLAFVCLAIAGMLLQVFGRQAAFVSQGLAMLSGFIAFFAVLGYFFDISSFYRMSTASVAITLPAALLTVSLSIATLAAQRECGPMKLLSSGSIGGLMARKIFLGVLTSTFFVGWFVWTAQSAGWMTPMAGIMFLVAASAFTSVTWIYRLGTEIDAAETGRRGTERLLREIINSAPSVIYVKNLNGELILTNAEFDRAILAEAKELAQPLNSEAKQAHLEPAELEVIQVKDRVEREEKMTGVQDVKTYLASRFPIYDSGERVIGVCGILTDVTKLKEYQEELKRSQDGFRVLADTIPSIVWSGDITKGISYFNKRWYEYSGQNSEEAKGTGWAKVVHPDDLEFTARAWEHSMSTNEPLILEHRMRRKDGEYRWHLVRGLPLRLPGSSYARWYGSTTDIHDQKRLAETLEREVEERTKELTAANRELEAFSYSVSHDLRAPLRSMDGFSQILLERYGPKLDDIGRSYLQRIRGASQNMAMLIDDLLTLSRISRTEVVREPVDLSAMAEEIMQEKQKSEPWRDVEARIQPGMKAMADKGLIRVALWNLLDNAWKYTSKKDQAVIEFNAREADGRNEFAIRDNGAGFSMEHADQLFKPFQRLHTEREFPGTGIGLATASRVLERHGGTIWADGVPERGATFHFVIGPVSPSQLGRA